MSLNSFNSPSGFNFWEGWLIFDDPAAERIIKECLIPWFCPALLNFRLTVTSSENIAAVFSALHRYEKFNAYCPVCENNNVWVLLNQSSEAEILIDDLICSYEFEGELVFQIFSQPYFEYYYPPEFKQNVEDIIYTGCENVQTRRVLLDEVLDWLNSDIERGKAILEETAGEVITYLRQIEGRF